MLEYIRKRIRSLAGAAQRLKNDTELFKQFMDIQSFKSPRFLLPLNILIPLICCPLRFLFRLKILESRSD